MPTKQWHRSNSVLGIVLAILAVFAGFSIVALDGPLRIALAVVLLVGVVAVVARMGQNRKTA
ncbi:hypothetical protein [Nocardiopsis algeriensis]|uniref:Asparagine N-glycosylation enzyme membrane subunit Stt3 n=1 Tax=Nocardiopsis algeriensis TaxID=1478215 RepID=A0A841IK23_9ACTN|nr:hypothetical protein [Nocardiopsis algeriensis]MBB6118412.1 asparagine N-glycosylation enzyme membrane subunit Stt3 [Nocardiopsis algeriensis]